MTPTNTPIHGVVMWNTTKVDGGFRWQVIAIAYRTPVRVLDYGRCPTRAIATRVARSFAGKYRRAAASAKGE